MFLQRTDAILEGAASTFDSYENLIVMKYEGEYNHQIVCKTIKTVFWKEGKPLQSSCAK